MFSECLPKGRTGIFKHLIKVGKEHLDRANPTHAAANLPDLLQHPAESETNLQFQGKDIGSNK